MKKVEIPSTVTTSDKVKIRQQEAYRYE